MFMKSTIAVNNALANMMFPYAQCLLRISKSLGLTSPILFGEVLHPQHFYNIFETNHRWLVIIRSNLNLVLRLLF